MLRGFLLGVLVIFWFVRLAGREESGDMAAMASKRLNVLVYSGNGSTVESVRHAVYSLRRMLSPFYAVLPVTGEAIIKEPWSASCAMLVMPGGADMGYCRTLNGEGNRRISQYIERGGAYLGFCAGGYYGSSRCEFEVGDKNMEVVGSRELAFFPGTCRGCAYKGFVYHSEKGARAIELKVNKDVLTEGMVPDTFTSYYNGGGVFVDATKFKDRGVEVLASFTEKLSVDAGEGAAAVVYCKVGEGAAILTSPHPEFAPVNLNPEATPDFPKVIDAIAREDALRADFFKACLRRLGLKVNEDENAVPSLSRLHLSSIQPNGTTEVMAALKDIITTEEGEDYIKDDNDTFHLEKQSAWSFQPLQDAMPESSNSGQKDADLSSTKTEDKIVDYNAIVKRLVVHEKDAPSGKETPYFNHSAYYSNLKHYQSVEPYANSAYGQNVLYGEVVTSTNTMLEKNTNILRRLPSGFLATATIQVAGRGRGSNVWVSPSGSLMFSLVIRHPSSLLLRAPVVFLQYLAALALVEGIHSYDPSNPAFAALPIHVKWPNDIYALDPSIDARARKMPAKRSYVKIGGILVNSHYSAEEYISVIGIGLNVGNKEPTTSVAALLAREVQMMMAEDSTPASSSPAANIVPEKLLARLVVSFSALYTRFCDSGFDSWFEKLYYKHWLHSGQMILLHQSAERVGDNSRDVTSGGSGSDVLLQRARIVGITRDWGFLKAELLEKAGDWGDHGYGDQSDGRGTRGWRGTGRVVELQSDMNSFDFWSGFVQRKV